MNDQFSLHDNRRSEMPPSEGTTCVQAFRDTRALEYALSLSSGEAEALAQDLARLRDSKDGFSTVSYRLLRAVHARRRFRDGLPETDELNQPVGSRPTLRAKFCGTRKTG